MVNYSIAASDYCIIPSEVDIDSKLAVQRCVEIIKEYQMERSERRSGRVIMEKHQVRIAAANAAVFDFDFDPLFIRKHRFRDVSITEAG